MTSVKSLPRLCLYISILSFIIFALLNVLHIEDVKAISRRLPDASDNAFGVTNTRERYLLTAQSELDAPRAYAYAYIPISQTVANITIVHGNWCGYGSIAGGWNPGSGLIPSGSHPWIDGGYNYNVTYHLAEGTSRRTHTTSSVSNGCVTPNVDIQAPVAGSPIVSLEIGDFYEVRFEAIMDAGTSFAENAFIFRVNNSGAWAGYTGEEYDDNGQRFAITNIQGGSNEDIINVGLEFGVPCNGSENLPIVAFDNDVGTSIQSTPIRWDLYRRPRADSGGQPYNHVTGGSLNGGNGVDDPVYSFFSYEYDYFIVFSGIKRQNGIQFQLPYNQIEAYEEPCDPPPDPEDGTLSCGTTTATSITVNWETENTTNARIRRGSTTVGSNLASTGTGTRADTGLSSGTSYTYILRNNSNSGTELDRVTCSTSPPTTSCSASNATGYVGRSISFSATVTITNNNSAYTLKGHHSVDGGSYTDWGAISSNTFTGSETFTSTGNKSITIQVGLFNPSNASSPSSGTTDTCTLTVTVYALPTCTTPSSFDVWAGQGFRSNVTVSNTASASLNVTSISYVIREAGETTNIVSRTSTTDAPNVSSNSSRSYSFGSSGSPPSLHYDTLSTPGDYVVIWTVNTSSAGEVRNGAATPAKCRTNIYVRSLPVECTNNTQSFDVGERVRVSIPLSNQPPVTPSNYTAEVDDDDWSDGTNSGDILRVDPNDSTNYVRVQDTPLVLANNSFSAGTLYTDEVQYDTNGIVTMSWDVNVAYDIDGRTASGYRLRAMDVDDELNCETTLRIIRRPYVRMYGNDVVAGSVLIREGEECSDTDLLGVSDVGIQSVSGTIDVGSDAYYQGSAAELAAIATGDISHFLPGTGSFFSNGLSVRPDTPNSSEKPFEAGNVDFLALAGGGIGRADIGGGYAGGAVCNEVFPDVTEWVETSMSDATLVDNGFWKQSSAGDETFGGVTLPAGTRVSIYVDGNITIDGNITYDTAGWNAPEDIPLLRLYASGNITINGDVSRLEGLYVAGGTINTCTEFEETNDVADAGNVIAACGDTTNLKTLTLLGAFVANNIDFYRTGGDVRASNADPVGSPELGFSNGDKAENLHFYPELYIGLYDLEPDGSTGSVTGYPQRIDYISSPPPVF